MNYGARRTFWITWWVGLAVTWTWGPILGHRLNWWVVLAAGLAGVAVAFVWNRVIVPWRWRRIIRRGTRL